MDNKQEERVLRWHRKGIPSSHIARRLGLERREVNHTIKKTERRGNHVSDKERNA